MNPYTRACFGFLATLLLSTSLIGQTTIRPYEKVSGKWTREGSPYLVQGEAIVPAGKTLNIEAGTVVLFKTGIQPDYAESGFDLGLLRVRGRLIAKGTADQMITFSRDGEDGRWGQLFLEGQEDASSLQYCRISHAQFIRSIVPNDNGTAAVTFYRSKGEVRNCIITGSWAAINCKKGANPSLYHNVFANNKYGVEANSGSDPEVYNSIFWGNETDFFLKGEGSRIRLSHSLVGKAELATEVLNGGNVQQLADPKFANAEIGDFHLAPGSPCIRAGRSGTDLGAFPDDHTSKKNTAKNSVDRKKRKGSSREIDPQAAAPIYAGNLSFDPTYHALLIGVKSHEDRRIPTNKKAVRSIRKLRSVLSHRYGFDERHIQVMANPGKAEIVAALEQLRETLGPEDHLLICFSGQSEWDEYQRVGYWLPQDANQLHSNTWLSHERVLNLLAYCENRHTLLLSDTPFSGLQNLRSSTKEDLSLDLLRKMNSRKGIVSQQVSTDPDQPAVWMQTLLQTLSSNQSPYLTSEILLTRLTMANSQGTFMGGTLLNIGDQGGEFLLKKQ